MTFLLDANICSAAMTGRSKRAQRLFQGAARRRELFTSTIVEFELWYGVAKGERGRRHADAVAMILAQMASIPFERDDAREAGEIRAYLVKVGMPIGAYDTLLAGQARRRSLTLVTANLREFTRVPGLSVENWLD